MKPDVQARTRFVTVSTQRSGSTWLTDMLNSHPDVASYTELFLMQGQGAPEWGKYKDVVYWKTYRETLGAGLRRSVRPLGLFQYLDDVYGRHPEKRAIGLKLMYGQMAKLPETLAYLRSRKVRIIHLVRRNIVDVVLSGVAKAARKVAHAEQGSAVESIRVHIEPDRLVRQLRRRQREQRAFSLLLGHLGLPYLELFYEDIVDDRSRLTACLGFLGCSALPLDSSLSKLNPSRHSELIENFAQVQAALAATRFSGLLRP